MLYWLKAGQRSNITVSQQRERQCVDCSMFSVTVLARDEVACQYLQLQLQ